MKYLLDSHVFLWLNGNPSRLSEPVQKLLTSTDHSFCLSMVAPWEIQIKQQLGKLQLDVPFSKIVRTHLDDGNLELLSIELTHIERLGTLEPHHRDPFDRMLIAQAMVEGMVLVSADRAFGEYPVDVFW